MEPFQPHQQRVVEEKYQLDEKLEKLCEFLITDLFKTLSIDEQSRLHRQQSAMMLYSGILKERIAAFQKD